MQGGNRSLHGIAFMVYRYRIMQRMPDIYIQIRMEIMKRIPFIFAGFYLTLITMNTWVSKLARIPVLEKDYLQAGRMACTLLTGIPLVNENTPPLGTVWTATATHCPVGGKCAQGKSLAPAAGPQVTIVQ